MNDSNLGNHNKTTKNKMKTLQQVKESYKSKTLDGRDITRLMDFVPVEEWEHFGVSIKEGVDSSTIKPQEWTKENMLPQLEADVSFGFEKALNKRGISAGLMFDVVRMWNWILEDGLEDWDEDNYAQYGLPLFKATALKYGFDNPIGDHAGNESQYESD